MMWKWTNTNRGSQKPHKPLMAEGERIDDKYTNARKYE